MPSLCSSLRDAEARRGPSRRRTRVSGGSRGRSRRRRRRSRRSPALVIQFLVPLMTHSSPSRHGGRAHRRAGRSRPRARDSANAGDHSPVAHLRQEPLLQLVGAEQLDRQRAELLDHQDQRARRARLGDLLDRHLQHQRAGAGAAVLLGERQPEDVLLGEQLADVPRVLALRVDLGGARRDALRDDLADRVAEVLVLLREVVDVGGGGVSSLKAYGHGVSCVSMRGKHRGRRLSPMARHGSPTPTTCRRSSRISATRSGRSPANTI